MNHQVGFMQGRLSPLVNGRIQAFPWQHWEAEYPQAERLGLRLMEWTLDQEGLHRNPLLTSTGRERIQALRAARGVRVASVTGDCFMQAPFWKAAGDERRRLQSDFLAVADGCGELGGAAIVVPLVDNGALADRGQEDVLVDWLLEQRARFEGAQVTILFECDFVPEELARFIGRLPHPTFGINYDIGNSAALGYAPAEEFDAYGPRVLNVHVKDRVRGGTTVPLGAGDADFDTVFARLRLAGYRGNFILQTARAADGEHAATLARYRDMTLRWLAA